ncbi:MAG: hypothetical protein OQL19_00075 [Gammaproteobacteria bacterium]|nr:hypothetical protein [Gammaproteobacteria bacterium]
MELELQKQLETEIAELEQLVEVGQQQNEPQYLIRMYKSLIKSKKEKLKHLLAFSC